MGLVPESSGAERAGLEWPSALPPRLSLQIGHGSGAQAQRCPAGPEEAMGHSHLPLPSSDFMSSQPLAQQARPQSSRYSSFAPRGSPPLRSRAELQPRRGPDQRGGSPRGRAWLRPESPSSVLAPAAPEAGHPALPRAPFYPFSQEGPPTPGISGVPRLPGRPPRLPEARRQGGGGRKPHPPAYGPRDEGEAAATAWITSCTGKTAPAGGMNTRGSLPSSTACLSGAGGPTWARGSRATSVSTGPPGRASCPPR
ncbi:translation initiation factor IF-2-like [Bubalus kerabau]|uniref:translation initiation factor IF-2-like n=1 Tax=Bubalus carabanensis TaxID=3119969 RepID=UPI00244E5F55|nr:translation initiation factor IF-2-like [Bubalus carabanensis]